jgi:hypothetical protein
MKKLYYMRFETNEGGMDEFFVEATTFNAALGIARRYRLNVDGLDHSEDDPEAFDTVYMPVVREEDLVSGD